MEGGNNYTDPFQTAYAPAMIRLALGVRSVSSSDLLSECDSILADFAEATSARAAALWLRSDFWVGDQETGVLRLAGATASGAAPPSGISSEHPLVVAAGSQLTPVARADVRSLGLEDLRPDAFVAAMNMRGAGLMVAAWDDPSGPDWASEPLLASILEAFGDALIGILEVREHEVESAAVQGTLEMLTAAASRLSGLIENLQSAILVEDGQRRIALANKAFCDMFGVPVDPSYLQGADCEEALQSASTLFENPTGFVKRVSDLLNQKQVVVGEELLMADGRTLERDYIPVFLDGHYEGHMWHYRDVSESRKAQKEIGESAHRLYTVIETVGEGITLHDPDEGFEIFNSKMQEITGYSFAEANHSDFFELLYADEDELGAARARDHVVLNEGRDIRDAEVRVRHRDGDTRILLASMSALGYKGRKMLLSTFRDITEQKETGNKVQYLKDFYEQVLDAMPAQLAVFDPDLRYEYVSTSAVADPDLREWLIGKTDLDYCLHRGIDPSVGETRIAQLGEVLSSKEVRRFEEKLFTKTGAERYIVRFVAPVLDQAGDVVRILGYGLDVTEQRLAEKAQRESESRYEQLVEQAGDIIYRADLAGRFTYANRVAQKLTGFAEEEIVGRGFAELVHEDWRDTVQAFYERQVSTRDENTYMEFPIRTKPGDIMWLGQNVQLVFDGNTCVGVQAVARDVSARRKAMDALEESEARNRGIMESALDCMITIDEQGNVIEFNPAAESTFGYLRQEVIGKPMAELIVPEKYRDAHMAGLKRYRDTGRGNVIGKRIEISALRRDGSEFPVELAIKPIQLEGGQMFTAFLRDITDLKRTMNELQEARQIAIRSMKAREQFLANMSHEIRTPMNGILGMAHLLRNTSPTPKQLTYLDAMTTSAENLLSLINDVLDLAKIESGRIEFEHIPFKPQEVAKHVVDMVRYPAQEKGLGVASHISPEVASQLIGDPVRLNQILLNLVSNAVKFTEAGNVTLTVRSVERSDDREVLEFEVTDTGIGIAQEQLQRIFETFTQARSDTTRLYGGTGLGLSIVRELVERQDGTVTVESVPGEGSTFRVSLPFSRPADTDSEDEVATVAERSLEGKHVLVVEDNELNQLVTRSLLEDWGAKVTVVANGRAAVGQVKREKYDLVLMDIQMPEMDGYQATRQIRVGLEITSDVLPIIALTASTMVEHRHDIQSAGMNDFVLKPFAPADLRSCILRHLGPRVTIQETRAPSGSGIVNLDFLRRNAVASEALIPRLIDMFIEKTPGMLSQIRTAFEEGNLEAVGFVAHKLKSSAGMLGADPLSSVLSSVEAVARQRAEGDLGALIDDATRLSDHAVEELYRERQSMQRLD